jgi:hypothetical protein
MATESLLHALLCPRPTLVLCKEAAGLSTLSSDASLILTYPILGNAIVFLFKGS